MDSSEQVRIGDVVLFGISVFMSAALLTLFIIQYFLWKGEEQRIAENLEKLSTDIEQSFITEVNIAYQQLEKLDSLRNNDADLINKEGKKNIDYGTEVRNYLANTKTAFKELLFF